MRLIAALGLCTLLAGPALGQGMPYAGQQGREIKALSAQEQADLLAGRGMGFARAGELNHYPGPAHVLDLREQLALSPDQIAAVRAEFARMSDAARPLGAALVAREQALDDAFRAASITPASLSAQTAEIADLQGRLRAVHLAAHLSVRALLTPEQVAAYDRLRGYGEAAPDGHAGMHKG